MVNIADVVSQVQQFRQCGYDSPSRGWRFGQVARAVRDLRAGLIHRSARRGRLQDQRERGGQWTYMTLNTPKWREDTDIARTGHFVWPIHTVNKVDEPRYKITIQSRLTMKGGITAFHKGKGGSSRRCGAVRRCKKRTRNIRSPSFWANHSRNQKDKNEKTGNINWPIYRKADIVHQQINHFDGIRYWRGKWWSIQSSVSPGKKILRSVMVAPGERGRNWWPYIKAKHQRDGYWSHPEIRFTDSSPQRFYPEYGKTISYSASLGAQPFNQQREETGSHTRRSAPGSRENWKKVEAASNAMHVLIQYNIQSPHKPEKLYPRNIPACCVLAFELIQSLCSTHAPKLFSRVFFDEAHHFKSSDLNT